MLRTITRNFKLTYCTQNAEFNSEKLGKALGGEGAELLDYIPRRWRPTECMLAKRSYDIVLIEFWYTAERVHSEIRRRQPWTKIVVDSVDVHFTREELAAQLGLLDPAVASKNKNSELAVYGAADAVIVVTETDRQTLLDAGITNPIYVIPNIVAIRPRPSMKRESMILFVGASRISPMVTASPGL